MRMFDYDYIHPGFIFIPCPNTTPGGLRAQYLIPNLMPKCECPSIRPFLPFGPRHHAIPRIQRKQSFCRTKTYCRPQAFLPNPLKKSSPAERNLLPSSAHKLASFLYQFLVLTRVRWSLRLQPSRSSTRRRWQHERDGIKLNLAELKIAMDLNFDISIVGQAILFCRDNRRTFLLSAEAGVLCLLSPSTAVTKFSCLDKEQMSSRTISCTWQLNGAPSESVSATFIRLLFRISLK
jgi:hypothetical protein